MPERVASVDGVADGGERVPQLVGEHRQELVLAAVGLLQLVRPLLEGLLELPLLGLVADDFQEAPNLVGVVLQGHDEPLGPERLAAFPQVPAFIEGPAFGRRGPHLLVRLVGLEVLGREDDPEVLAEDFGLAVAEHLLGPGVPARNDALGVEREDGEARWPPRR